VADFCTCSACGSNLRGPIIEPSHREMYGGYVECRHGCGSEPHYSRLMGIYDMERDRTVAWRCPDCGHEEARRG
jgi:predicted RNA-binding Zn-ribbon protein involved in translation (DUF1610 family)